MLQQFTVTTMAPQKPPSKACSIKLRNAIVNVHLQIVNFFMYHPGMAYHPLPSEVISKTSKPLNIIVKNTISPSSSGTRTFTKSSDGQPITLKTPRVITSTTNRNYNNLHYLIKNNIILPLF